MAFTLYIGQSVVLYILFVFIVPQYWGELGRASLFLLTFVLCLLQIAFAHNWRQKKGQGPLEKLWRQLAYKTPSVD